MRQYRENQLGCRESGVRPQITILKKERNETMKKTKQNRVQSILVAIGLAASVGVACGAAARPAPKPLPVAPPTAIAKGKTMPKHPPTVMPTAPVAAEIGLLRHAHGLLATAGHDYKGHRGLAMRDTAAAAKLLGAPLGGSAGGREPRGASDAKLRAARAALEQCLTMARVHNQRGVVEHTAAAIRQISIALSIR
jgi:hypothetical protein